MNPNPLLVIGVGNEYRKDDGAGLLAARNLKPRVGGDVSVLEQSGEAAALMESFSGADRVILIDAVQSGKAPGTVHCFEAGDAPLPAKLFRCSTHAFGVAESVELARALHQLPGQVTLYGIEGKDFASGVGLSPEVDRAVQKLCEQLTRELT